MIKLKVKCYLNLLVMSRNHVFELSKPATDLPFDALYLSDILTVSSRRCELPVISCNTIKSLKQTGISAFNNNN